MAVDLVTLAQVKEYLGVSGSDDDALLTRLITSESQRINTYCDRHFRNKTYVEFYNGTGQRRLRLRNFPVTSVHHLAIGSKLAFTVNSTIATDIRVVVEVQDDRVHIERHDVNCDQTNTNITFSTYKTASQIVAQINRVTGLSAALGSECLVEDLFRYGSVNVHTSPGQFYFPDRDDIPYRVHEDRATLEFVDTADMLFFGRRSDVGLPFPHTFAGISVEYVAGYDLDDVPADLAQACIELVQFAYSNKAENTTMQSESIGSYSYTRGGDPIRSSERMMQLLAQYVDRKS